ncbi:MAG: hypothetical protein ACLUD2_10345 [Clostridium sp.]
MPTLGNHTRAQALLDEIGFPEELVVNTSIEKAAGISRIYINHSIWEVRHMINF